MQIWIATASREPDRYGVPRNNKRLIREVLDLCDTKKWQIGKEVGKNGYKHFQIRAQTSGDLFEQAQKMNLDWHIEKSDKWSDYEKKEANYWTSDDSTDNLKERYGTPNEAQKEVLRALHRTNNRQVVCWHDMKGNVGKSWLGKHLFETGQAHYTRYVEGASAESIVKDMCAKMAISRKPIAVIDVPRAGHWDSRLSTAIEVIKDGLIDDPRFSPTSINISGVKVLVLTNRKPDKRGLSEDRWVFAPSST